MTYFSKTARVHHTQRQQPFTYVECQCAKHSPTPVSARER